MLADATIDAIVIASSTESHAPLIVAAAEAGKQIFCEKPIALDLEATDRALDAVERAGGVPDGFPAPLRQGLSSRRRSSSTPARWDDRSHSRHDA